MSSSVFGFTAWTKTKAAQICHRRGLEILILAVSSDFPTASSKGKLLCASKAAENADLVGKDR